MSENKMTDDAKKVWEELENMGWSNKPENMHLEYFEDIIEATKKVLNIPVVSQQRELLLKFLEYYHDPVYDRSNTRYEEDVDMFLTN